MTTKEQLEQKARATVEAVWNDPAGRLALRQKFYRIHGHSELMAAPADAEPEFFEYGYGRSEIDFMRWEARRGVLNETGSAWWRGVNGDFLYWSELASLAYDAQAVDLNWELPVRRWLDYIAKPGSRTWYRAHNTSIVQGYRTRVKEAENEPNTEQVFVNIVLYRLFFAQALVEDITGFGALGELIADPRLPAVQALVHLPDFYPKGYPLTPEEFAKVTGHGGFSLEEIAVRLLDQLLLAPHITDLYNAAAAWSGIDEVVTMQTQNKPTYPVNVVPIPSPMTPKKPLEKKKIVILGGGVSALAAAWELTSYEGWQDQYDITLYQLGWRCGGKAGGGRGVHGRVEELGLHLLLGFYVNAFPMFQEAYAERTKLNLWPTAKYKTLPDALAPNWGALLVDRDTKTRSWRNWPMIFPPSDGYPGDGPPLSTWQLIKRGIALMLETLLGSPYGNEIGPLAKWLLDQFFPKEDEVASPPSSNEAHLLLPNIFKEVREGLASLSPEVDSLLSGFESRIIKEAVGLDDLVNYLKGIVQWLASKLIESDENLLHMYWFFDFGVAMLAGIILDVWDPQTGKFNYRNINNQDFRAWLKKHGASTSTLFSPVVTFFYTGTFEALADGNDQGGALAAGTALQFALPALGYKGSFMFQLRLGTADTLVMPLYQVLAARGVKFEYFCEVKNIPWTGSKSIDRIELERQVDLVVPTYDPVINVKGNPCWPSEPKYDQIDPVQAKKLQDEKINLESPWSGWKGKPFSLEKGKDFDLVILGIPNKAQAAICKEIMANRPDWKAMVEGICTAQVQSAQLWFTPSLADLGYIPADWGMKEGTTAPNVVTYQNPMFSWLDQSYIIENEDWPAENTPKVLAMYTGILPNSATVPPVGQPSAYPEQQLERVQFLTWQWLMDNMGWFFPKAQTPAYPAGIDMTLLTPTSNDANTATQKYNQQWFAAAVAPTNQYVIAVPDTEKYRMQPGGSGFENMYLVGDWTDYGTNIGYMEGCVVSAKEAVECLRERVFGLYNHRVFWRDQESDWVRQS